MQFPEKAVILLSNCERKFLHPLFFDFLLLLLSDFQNPKTLSVHVQPTFYPKFFRWHTLQ